MRGYTLRLLGAVALTLLGFVLSSALFARSFTYASSLASPALAQAGTTVSDQATTSASNCQVWDNSCHYCSWHVGSDLCPASFGGRAVVSAVVTQPPAAYSPPSSAGQSGGTSNCQAWDNSCHYCSWHVGSALCP